MMNHLTLADSLGSANLPVQEVEPCFERDGGPQTGLLVMFGNGMTLSVQWHSGAYSNVGRGFQNPGDEPTFEAAAWFPEAFDAPTPWGRMGRKWFSPWNDGAEFRGDDALAYVTVAEVLEFARKVATHEFVTPCV